LASITGDSTVLEIICAHLRHLWFRGLKKLAVPSEALAKEWGPRPDAYGYASQQFLAAKSGRRDYCV
jgi:hypothetical protein